MKCNVFYVFSAAAFFALSAAGFSQEIKNPVYRSSAADPGVYKANGKWYVCHTSSCKEDGVIPIMSSEDLTSWTLEGYGFKTGHYPKWAQKNCNWWAPEIHKVGDKYVLYFCAREDRNGKFALGIAVSDNPAGPFVDTGQPVLVNDRVGLIDVSYFEDPKSKAKYLLWKEDRNDLNPQEPTPLLMQKLSDDGLSLTSGTATQILVNDLPWEGVLVEAPSIIYENGYYYLFYSANGFADDAYAVGVARSKNLTGPYIKKSEPILRHNKIWSGPGHQFVIKNETGEWSLFYHARDKRKNSRSRFLMHDIIKWDEEKWPVIGKNAQPSDMTISVKP